MARDIIKLTICILAVIGWMQLCLSRQWVGAIGVSLFIYTNTGEYFQAALRIDKKLNEWWKERKNKEGKT